MIAEEAQAISTPAGPSSGSAGICSVGPEFRGFVQIHSILGNAAVLPVAVVMGQNCQPVDKLYGRNF